MFNRHFSDSRLSFITEIEHGKTLTSIYSHPKLPMFCTKFISNDRNFTTDAKSDKELNSVDDEPDLILYEKIDEIKNKINKVSEKKIVEVKTTEKLNNSVEILSVNQILSFFNSE